MKQDSNTVFDLIKNNPFNPIRSGLIERLADGKIFRFSQNKSELNIGYAVLSEVVPIKFPVSDLDCVLCGLSFESAIIPTSGMFDINYGFEILKTFNDGN